MQAEGGPPPATSTRYNSAVFPIFRPLTLYKTPSQQTCKATFVFSSHHHSIEAQDKIDIRPFVGRMTISTDLLLQMAAIGLAGQTVMVVWSICARLTFADGQTGGSGGIGAAITKMFKAADCNVVVIGSNQSKLDDLVKSLDKGNGQAWAYVCDIRDPKQVDDMIRKAVDDCPPIDILINNVCRYDALICDAQPMLITQSRRVTL